jgi:aminoglycoside phosphotransferase (APT) family kinase protein
MPKSLGSAVLLAKGSTADVYAWEEGRALKLFHERVPWHANEVAATRAAHEAGLPVPAVVEGLIEVDGREGIVFERLEGPTLTEVLQEQPEGRSPSDVEDCARQAAELHAQIHSTEVPGLPALAEILHWSIQQADPLADETRQAILDLLHGLPEGNALCHNDYYPGNLILPAHRPPAGGLWVIDWAIGTRGHPLADCARTWLISRMWLELLEGQASGYVCRLWQRFWELYFRRYGELRPYSPQDLLPWQIVASAASLCWDGSVTATEPRVSFVRAALSGGEHPWLSCLESTEPIASA